MPMNGEGLYISFERSGGFAGMMNTVEISGDTLAPEELDQLIELVNNSGFFEFDTSDIAETNYPDQFNYRIEIRLNEQSNTIDIGESAINDKLRPLIDHLSSLARRRR